MAEYFAFNAQHAIDYIKHLIKSGEFEIFSKRARAYSL